MISNSYTILLLQQTARWCVYLCNIRHHPCVPAVAAQSKAAADRRLTRTAAAGCRRARDAFVAFTGLPAAARRRRAGRLDGDAGQVSFAGAQA